MKVILTEGQLKYVIQEEINEAALVESLFGLDNNTIIRKIVIALLSGYITFGVLPSLLNKVFYDKPNGQKEKVEVFEKIKELFNNAKENGPENNETTVADSNFEEKVDALKEYMEIAAKNQNYDPKNIQISPKAMIFACNQTGFDLPLLIAQAHLESCFGLTPRARRTNSVFSVGSYDNGKDVCTYNSQNESILPYISLIQKNYLNGKTVDDILKPGAFVNGAKNRYASDKNYEKKVANIRNRIIKKYPILAS